MTDEQRRAITIVLKTYFMSEYYISDMWDNDYIKYALSTLFSEAITNPEELSKEIKSFTDVYVPTHVLQYAAKGIFIGITKGGKQDV